MNDVITVYKRIFSAARAGKGVRLSNEDCLLIMCDGAVRQAVETADYEDIAGEHERLKKQFPA